MAINAVSSSTAAAQLLPVQPEANEVHRAGRDKSNDGDSDDGGATQAAAPKPTVNSQGQTIGSVINTTA